MREVEFQNRVIATAQTYGWHVAHFRPARTSKGYRTPMQGDRGFPDLVLARAGTVLLVELKTDTGRLRSEQHRWITALGTHARVWRPRDWDTIRSELHTPDVAHDEHA